MNYADFQQHLFTGRTHVYAILDGASIDGLRTRLYELRPPHYCLFRGELAPDVAETAPYLVALIAGTPFAEWVMAEHFGKHWGIFAQSRQSITEMRKHFRALVTVHDESGKSMIFRYYDPRVLHKFLPTCNGGELATFFGKVDAFFAENKDGNGVSRFTLENKALKETKID
jgi:hypothetical protein